MPNLIILTGKTASGKDTIKDLLLQRLSHIKRIITTTSRSPRPYEESGVDYFFISKNEFMNKIKNNEVVDYQVIFNKLKNYDSSIKAGNDVKEIFFKVPAKIIKIGEDKIQVYEYSSAEEMEKEASMISDEGYKVKNVIINWFKPPHFYKKDNILILYLGDDENIKNELEKIAGNEFIGKGIKVNTSISS